MQYSKVATKEDVELETFKNYLNNRAIVFDEALIDANKNEPTDIRYDGVNYQITEGDKEAVQECRRITSKGISYCTIRDINNIAEVLLRGALTKKSIRSDSNTVLLISVGSTGGRDFESLGKELSYWVSENITICNCWMDIYLVYSEANVRLVL